jgi:hypothetical protein
VQQALRDLIFRWGKQVPRSICAYWLEITGPQNGLVDTHVMASGNGTGTGFNIGIASRFMITSIAGLISVDEQHNQQGSWLLDQNISLSANTLYRVDLYIGAAVSIPPGFGNGTVDAFIDPVFTIAPRL